MKVSDYQTISTSICIANKYISIDEVLIILAREKICLNAQYESDWLKVA